MTRTSAQRYNDRMDKIFSDAKRLKAEREAPQLLAAAEAFLRRIDDITTADFASGGDRTEREALRAVIARATK